MIEQKIKTTPHRDEIKQMIEMMIKKAMPKATVQFVFPGGIQDNRFYVCPEPWTTLAIMFTGSDYNVKVVCVDVNFNAETNELTTSVKTICDGSLPPDKNMEPDFDFLETILKNYKILAV